MKSIQDLRMLSICFDAMGFSYCVVEKNKLKHTGRFWRDEKSSDEQITQIQKYIDLHRHLNAFFEKVAISFVNRWQVLVPELFYKEEREEEFLQFNVFLKDDMPLEKNDLPAYQAKLIFSYNEEIERWVKKRHPKVSLFHCGTLLLMSSLKTKEIGIQMHLLFHPGQFDMSIINGKQLLLYNNFRYDTAEEVLYYVVFTAERWRVNLHQLPIYIGGYIYPYDPVFKLLSSYLSRIKPEKPNSSFHVKSEILHNYYHLLLALECELSREN